MKKKAKKERVQKAKEVKAAVPAAPTAVQAPPAQEVKVGKAKGRAMLVWVGKRPLERVTAFPAQLVETFNPTGQKDGWQNLLFHGDNKDVLAWLLANGFRGKANLIYIDPPFDSGADYVRRVQLRGVARTTKLEGETYTLGEQIQYTDIWANDNYLQFMFERLLLLNELLADDGFIFLHVNHERSAFLRLVMEEVFGPENYRNTFIVEKSMGKNYYEGNRTKCINSSYDCILAFSKALDSCLRIPLYDLAPSIVEYIRESYFKKVTEFDEKVKGAEEDEGGEYYWGPFDAPGVRQYLQYELLGHRPTAGRHWAWTEDRAKQAVSRYIEGEKLKKLIRDKAELGCRLRDTASSGVVWNPGGGGPRQKVYITGKRRVSDIWSDTGVNDRTQDFPTAKTPRILHRIFDMIDLPPEGLILDCFAGSAVTLAVAQERGFRWIGCDINKGAIQTTSKRLQTIIEEQIDAQRKATRQGKFVEVAAADDFPPPASLAFSVFRVNDYDLQIQHNEAVNLACEHIGIERKRSDSYFDGTLGEKLVKIVPFNHPLSPLDLEELKKELKARPEEDRHIVVVCLGKEMAVDAWLDDWNRMRRQGRVPNRIEVIELRTDPKYGKFFVHKPAKAEVKIRRTKDKIVVEIEDFLSPTIIERLSAQEGVLKPQITDWRSMVDSVMIDAGYDGRAFNIALSDVPEKKTDLVEGRYELPAPDGPTTVAVKITDMLGEEVLVVKDV